MFLRRTRHVASIVTLLWAVGSSAWAQSPRQEQRRETDSKGKSPALTVPAPPAHQVPSAEPQTPSADAQPRDRYQWVWDKLWEVEWSNWALLIAAIWAGRLALRTLKTQTTQIKIGRSALGASRRAAEAAIASASIGKDHLVSVQRAFVNQEKILVENVTMIGSQKRTFWFRTVWRNEGSTPAVDVIVTSAMLELPNEPTAEDMTKHVGTKPFSAGYIGPKGTGHSGAIRKTEEYFFNVPVAGITEAVETQRKIYYFGWVAYRDVFSGTKPHVTQFSRLLTNVGFQMKPDGTPDFSHATFHWNHCQTGNGIDDACLGYEDIIALLPIRTAHDGEDH